MSAPMETSKHNLTEKRLLVVGRSSLLLRNDGYYATPNEGRYIEDLSAYFKKLTLCTTTYRESEFVSTTRPNRLNDSNIFASRVYRLNDGIAVIELPISSEPGFLLKLWHYIVALRQLVAASAKADIVHFFIPGFRGTLAWMVSFLRRLPTVVYVGGDWQAGAKLQVAGRGDKGVSSRLLHSAYVRMISCLERLVLGHTDIRLFRGDELYRRYQNCSKGHSYKMVIMTNITQRDIPQRSDDQRELHQPARLLYVGRLEREVGIDELLKALTLVKESEKQKVELWIVGDGPLLSHLQYQASALKLPIRFLGYVENGPPLLRVYRSCDVLIIPRLPGAGLPRVLIEGWSQGLPIVATNVGGIPDILKHDVNGLLVAPAEPQQLAQAILRMLEDKGLRTRCSLNGPKKALELLNNESAGEFTAKVIAEFLN